MNTKTYYVTGHRDIPKDKMEYVKAELRKAVFTAIQKGYIHFITGFSSGVDLYFGDIIAEIK